MVEVEQNASRQFNMVEYVINSSGVVICCCLVSDRDYQTWITNAGSSSMDGDYGPAAKRISWQRSLLEQKTVSRSRR